MDTIQIGSRIIGAGQPCYIIAEGGLNHNGDPELAVQLIKKAAECGADAVKFQTYTPGELFPPDHPDYAKFKKCVFSRKIYQELQKTAQENAIDFFSTPFDEASADLLESLQVPVFKVGSGELTHLAFLQYLAAKGKPMILSTGMSTFPQIDSAVKTIKEAGNPPLALLHCISAYPCPAENVNLHIMEQLQKRYPAPTGYSDHTTTDIAAVAAAALGACIIEKHFTLSHHLPGWDHFFSYDPEQFKHLVQSIRETGKVMGSTERCVQNPETPIEQIARRALYARSAIKAGQILCREDIVIRRPIGPMPADQIDLVLGKTAKIDIAAETALYPEELL